MAKPRALPLPRGCAWPCLVIGALLMLLGIGSVLGLGKCWVRSREDWPEAPGSIVEVYLREGTRDLHGDPRSSETTYDVRLKYGYLVEGRDFTGDAKALRQPPTDNRRDEALAVAGSYRAGDALAVFYRPGKEAVSRLTQREPAIEFGKDVFSTLIFLGLGAGGLLGGRAILRRYSQAPASLSSSRI